MEQDIKTEKIRRMQAKQATLRRMGEIEDMIEGNLCELAHWRGRALRVTSILSAMPRGERDDVLAEATAQALMIETRLKKSMKRLTREREKLVASIDTVSDVRCRELLKYRYLDRLTFEEIAEQMHYTWRWIMKLHKTALELYEPEQREAQDDGTQR